ncbi:MAG: fimbrillin family protein [Parabacteroides gordonii]|nr:fimbrillin family protein [Parabacteroides gordonii]
MRTKRYTIRQYLQKGMLVLAGAYLCGCTAEQLIDEPIDKPEGWSEVRFFTSVATRAEVLGTQAETLTDKAKVRLYPYRQKIGVTEPILIKDYEVANQESGGQQLSPVAPVDVPENNSATAMILPSGKFAFYAVTTNSATEDVPEFSTGGAVNGVPSLSTGTASVKNGVDYLFAKTEQTIVFGTEQTNVPLEFTHKGTQVQLTIQFSANACAPDETAASNFAEATVEIQTTSEADAKMRLNDGQIILSGNQTEGEPDKTGTLQQMAVKKEGDANGKIPATQVATYHMLPLKAAAGQKMDIKITIQNLKIGEAGATTRIYAGKLDASSGWLAGTSNRYTLTLSGTKIEFSPVTVVPWVNGSSGGEVGDVENKPASAQITE